VLVGCTTTTLDPRVAAPNDPRYRQLGDNLDGWRVHAHFDDGGLAVFRDQQYIYVHCMAQPPALYDLPASVGRPDSESSSAPDRPLGGTARIS